MYQYTLRVLPHASVTQRFQLRTAASKRFIFLNSSWKIIINPDSICLPAKLEAYMVSLKARRGLCLINAALGTRGHLGQLGKGFQKCELVRTRRRWWYCWEGLKAGLLKDCLWGEWQGRLDCRICLVERSWNPGLWALKRSGLQREVRGETGISCQVLGKGKRRPVLWPWGLTSKELSGRSLLGWGKTRRISRRCGLSWAGFLQSAQQDKGEQCHWERTSEFKSEPYVHKKEKTIFLSACF